MELADTPDLGSGAVRFGGSSPPSRILLPLVAALRISIICWSFLLLSACSLGSVRVRSLDEWCQSDYIRSSQLSEFVETLKNQGSLHHNVSSAQTGMEVPCSECSLLSLAAVSADGERVSISFLHPKTLKAVVLLTSNGERLGNEPPSIPGVSLLLQNGIGVAVAHTRAAGVSSSGLPSHSYAVQDIIEAARTLQALGYASPKNLFLRGANAGGWTVTSAALARPELFRGLILESPLLDIERVAPDRNLALYPHYLEAWGKDRSRLKELSPMEKKTDFFPLDIMMLVSLDDRAVPAVGNLEWLRRTTCGHPELRSVNLHTTIGPPPQERESSPTTGRGINLKEVDFILSTVRTAF